MEERRYTTTRWVLSVLAGHPSMGYMDGIGPSSRFKHPRSVAINPRDGSVLVTDTENNRIRKVTLQGHVTTIAGSGEAGMSEGDLLKASFNLPCGIIATNTGTIFVSDTRNHRIVEIHSRTGVKTVAPISKQGKLIDTFSYPQALTLHPTKKDTLLVADTGNKRVCIVVDGDVTHSYDVGISCPKSLACVSKEILVCDSDSTNNKICKIMEDETVVDIAGTSTSGYTDGFAVSARFFQPSGITCDQSGNNIYVADTKNSSIRRITKIASDSYVVDTLSIDFNSCQHLSDPSKRSFKPLSIAYHPFGNLIVCDSSNNTIYLLAPLIDVEIFKNDKDSFITSIRVTYLNDVKQQIKTQMDITADHFRLDIMHNGTYYELLDMRLLKSNVRLRVITTTTTTTTRPHSSEKTDSTLQSLDETEAE